MSEVTRELTSHKVDGLNESLNIEVRDGPGQGNACHHYMLTGFNTSTNPSCPFVERHGEPAEHSTVLFQNGPVGKVGFNGITNEALLAIVEDRLLGFQSGQFACRENAVALTKLQECMMWLQKRTRDRMARGVEGTHEK